MRIAIADLGSQTFHLLGARVDDTGAIVPELSRRHALRLGASIVDGRIPPDAWERGLAAVDDLAVAARMFGGEVFAVGTSILRDTEDGRAFALAASERFGVEVQILSGHEEAELVFLGARSALAPSHGRVAVLDLGGGSLEVAIGDADGLAATWSLPLGALRLRSLEDHAIADHVASTGRQAWRAVGEYEPDTLVLTGGSARLIGELHGRPTLDARSFHDLARRLDALDGPGRLALGIPQARLDTIVPAATILGAALAAVGGTAEVSARGLREGFVVRTIRRRSAADIANRA